MKRKSEMRKNEKKWRNAKKDKWQKEEKGRNNNGKMVEMKKKRETAK